MTNWITQEGYPVVNVTRRTVRNKIVFEIKQEYFLLSKPKKIKK
jgi:aminopeptidase N